MGTDETTLVPAPHSKVLVPRDGSGSAGDVAAAAFELLDAGVSPAELVVRLEVVPETADSLWRAWARMRGYLLVSEEGARAIKAACLTSGAEEPELVGCISRALNSDGRVCAECGADIARFCVRCPAVLARSVPTYTARAPIARRRRSSP